MAKLVLDTNSLSHVLSRNRNSSNQYLFITRKGRGIKENLNCLGVEYGYICKRKLSIPTLSNENNIR